MKNLEVTLPFFSRSPHIGVAHTFWKDHLHAESKVLDATVGNGHDTAFIAPLIFPGGQLIALDIQEKALQQAQMLLGNLYPIEWVLQSHETYPEQLPDDFLDLAVYNLGYLPGGDKACITETKSTEKSLSLIIQKIKKEGLLTVTTYSGHEGGDEEELAVENFFSTLERQKFGVISFSWPNRPKAPKLFIAKRL